MLPDFIMHTIIQELPKAELDRLVREAGFDPDNLIPPLQHDLPFALPYSGELDFNLSVGAFGENHMLPCRTLWTADLADDADAQERVMTKIHCSVHVLGRSEEDEGFAWALLDFDLLPRSAVDAMDAQIEEQAKMLELAGKSTS